ncbi:NADH-quinone oxidoreductase subunit B family protein [Edwardsiella ictaluri]|uniref:NADH-quinone oxidoreductase subunit B family protein n=1 Tax=Edwardsiella ictaluri TaxID=67780 RepID=UPI0009BE83C7|nr:NADH-quinone oxidoreductase subunit B family protein [Edwardsiella ictaluri]ARD39324.1 hydrogenase [Edwardsiella ictaluri]QPW27749.1 NADH-quinone oxidoreductase subunit B family protein [Edwardsiella ictaluri]
MSQIITTPPAAGALIGPRDANDQPVPITLDAQAARLKQTLLKDIRRSAYVYRVDCGGCNGCEIEIFAAISPLFDAERFGIKVVASPRHADILLFTGAVTRAMRIPAIRAYQSAPDPKIVISYGACGCSGGIFHDLYCVWGGTDKIVPVDVYIPGCPPTPAATLYGFAVALGLLDQKLKAQHHSQQDDEQAAILHPDIPQTLRVLIDREARRMSGYRYGRQLADKFMALLASRDAATLEQRLDRFLAAENDPRLSEVMGRLMQVCSDAAPRGDHR